MLARGPRKSQEEAGTNWRPNQQQKWVVTGTHVQGRKPVQELTKDRTEPTRTRRTQTMGRNQEHPRKDKPQRWM